MRRWKMIRRVVRAAVALGLVALVGVVYATARADDRDKRGAEEADDRDEGGRAEEGKRPPQTLPQGFESTRDLLRDAQMAARAPIYSAWIVESSRFLNVPSRAFMPDRGDRVTVDLPVNVGIIKLPGANAEITLYDSGWKQLAYIFNWNTSCCWDDLRHQIGQIGLNPNNVKRIVIGHGHWDHAGQLDSFPNATLYVQKEELKQIDFFLNYPTDFNGWHIRPVNTLNPLTGLLFEHPSKFCVRRPVCGNPPQNIQVNHA